MLFSDALLAGKLTQAGYLISFSFTQKALIVAIIKNKHISNSLVDFILFGKYTQKKKIKHLPLPTLHTARKSIPGQTGFKWFYVN